MSSLLSWTIDYRYHLLAALVAAALVDLWWDRRNGQRPSSRETWLNIGVFLLGALLQPLLIRRVHWDGLHAFMPWSRHVWPDTLPAFLACLLLADLCYYLWHRLSHAVPLLWAEHQVHHSSPELNFSTALRLPWLNPLYLWLFFLPLVAVGFSAPMAFTCMVVVVTGQFLVHHRSFPALPWLEGFLNTPSNHRVHHALNEGYRHKNFAGILVVWDRLFGTYVPEGAAPSFCQEGQGRHRDPFTVNAAPFVELFTRAARAGSAMGFVRTLGKGPLVAAAPRREKPR